MGERSKLGCVVGGVAYFDRVLADKAHQAAGAVLDGEGSIVLLVGGGLGAVISVVGPWGSKVKSQRSRVNTGNYSNPL